MQMHPMVMFSVLFVSAGFSAATAQCAEAQKSSAGSAQATMPNKDELLKQIKVCQDAFRNAQAIHAADPTLAKIDVLLGDLYEDAGMYPQSETTFQQAVQLYHDAPPAARADALGELAILHTLMGETRKAEKEDTEVIALREKVGDWRGAAFARSDLSNAEAKQGHFAKAVETAQKAVDTLANDPQVNTVDRVAAHQSLGYVLAKAGRCQEAIPVLKDTVELAKSGFGANSLMVGIDTFLLGRAAWECGDPADVAGWMQYGIERMKPDLGWGHVVYLTSLADYAKFLRERGQTEQAAEEERELRMAHSVVDARTMTEAPVNSLR